MSPMGTLMRNTQRQPVMPKMVWAPAKNPPTTGPRTEDVPNTARNMPWYRARSRGGTRSPRIVNARDMSPPAPSPWIPR